LEPVEAKQMYAVCAELGDTEYILCAFEDKKEAFAVFGATAVFQAYTHYEDESLFVKTYRTMKEIEEACDTLQGLKVGDIVYYVRVPTEEELEAFTAGV
jgi:hypothetical protein